MIPPQLQDWRFILISPKSKIPIAEMKGWAANRETTTYTATNEKLLNHINNGGNYAVITGEDRFVLAADTKEVEHAIEERLPKTFTVQSPRHKTKHFYFYGKITKFIEFKPTQQGDPCCDLKFGNAYVIGAESTYDKYGKYKVIDDNPIATTTEDAILAALDEYIKTKTEKIEEQETEQNGSKLNPALNFDIKKLIPNIEAFTENSGILTGPHPKHGSRTGSNFRIDTQKNTWHCFRNGHESGGGPLELLAVIHDIINCENCHKGALRGTKFKLAISKAQELGYIGPLPINGMIYDSGEPAEDNEKLNTQALLSALKNKYIFKTPKDIEEIYLYNNGLYEQAEHTIKSELEAWLGAEATTHIVNEVLEHIKRSSYVNREIFNQYTGKIPVQNGLLNLMEKNLEPFNPESIFTFKLNASFKNDSQCPKWIKFLNEILNPEDIPLLQEYMGYCLLPKMPFHVLMWFYGKGRNGKGRIIKTIETIIGPEHCHNLNIEEFNGANRFSVAELYGKMVNISSEPSTLKSLQTPLIKKLTGEDRVSAEVKLKQKRIVFENMAKFFILGNRFPKIDDTTIAFWDRVLLIPFPKSFIGSERKINVEKEWLSDPEEISGILNWMLEGLYRLEAKQEFTKSKTTETTIIAFKRASDTVMSFLEEQCEPDVNKKYTREEFYDFYKEYCEYFGLIIEDERAFHSKIRTFVGVKSCYTKVDKKSARAWQGLKFKLLPENCDTDVSTDNLDTQSTLDTDIYLLEKNKEKYIEKREREKYVSHVDSVSNPVKCLKEAAETKVCGNCIHIRKPSCQYPGDFETIEDSNSWAYNCCGFVLNKSKINGVN